MEFDAGGEWETLENGGKKKKGKRKEVRER